MALINSVDSRFLLADLTGEIQQLPNIYGFINSLNLFTAAPTTQHSILLDVSKSDISLIDAQDGYAAQKAETQAYETLKQIALPLIPFKVVDSVTPAEIQGVRMAGTANQLETEARLRAKKLAKIRQRFEITSEFLKAGALRGVVKDPAGNVRLDAYAALGLGTAASAKTVIKFGLQDASGAQFEAAVEELLRHMEDNNQTGSVVNGQDILILVDSVFFQKLVTHPYLRDSYMAQQTAYAYQAITGTFRNGASDGVQQNMRVFEYRGIKFIQYNGQFQDNRGATHKLIENITAPAAGAGQGMAFPNVTMLPGNDLFQIAYAPVLKMQYVNTLGQPLYAFEYEKDRDEGVDFEAHSILLPFCTRPQLLVDITDEPRP